MLGRSWTHQTSRPAVLLQPLLPQPCSTLLLVSCCSVFTGAPDGRQVMDVMDQLLPVIFPDHVPELLLPPTHLNFARRPLLLQMQWWQEDHHRVHHRTQHGNHPPPYRC